MQQQREVSRSFRYCDELYFDLILRLGCGLVAKESKSRNRPIWRLVKNMTKVIYEVNNVTAMGSLFSDLCKKDTGAPSIQYV